MNQLEKWNRRMAKQKADEEVLIKTDNQKTDVERGAEIMKKATSINNISTEDVFAVIARDSIGVFTQMWANSVQSTIISTVKEDVVPMMRNEIRDMVREIIQEELQSAVRGTMRGFMEAMMPTIPVVTPEEPEIEIPKVESKPLSQRVKEEAETKEKRVAVVTIQNPKLDSLPRTKRGLDWTHIKENNLMENVLFTMLSVAEENNVNIDLGNRFKRLGTDFNGAYQRYMSENKGGGAWKRLVTSYKESK